MAYTKDKYIPRLIDTKIKKLLDFFGAVSIEGPKWCGKTYSAFMHSNSHFFLQDPRNNFENRTLAKTSIDSVLIGDYPRLIDEWQEAPEIWDAIRFRVDQDNSSKFILTGSTSSSFYKVLHSGAGRIAQLTMRTMSSYEAKDSDGSISLTEVLKSNNVSDSKIKEVTLDRIIYLVIRGGFPKSVSTFTDNVDDVYTKYYVKNLINEIVNQQNVVKIDSIKFYKYLRSLARNESTTVSDKKVISDVTNNNETFNERTYSNYQDLSKKLYLIDNINPFSPNLRSKLRLKQNVKRHFVDPSMVCALLDINKDNLKEDTLTLGFIFESLVLRDLLVYSDLYDFKVFHYQDYNDREIDAIISYENKWAAIEIKLGTNQIDEAAKKLLNLKNSFEKNNETPPSNLIIISGLASSAYKREDGVIVLPLLKLRP